MASGSLTVQEERDGHSPEPRKRPRESGRQEAVPDGRALCGICGGEMNVIHGPATIAPPVPACTTGGAVAEADRNIATAFLAGFVVRDLALVNHALELADHRQRSGQMLADAG
jgi:hypothetical protein